MNMNLYQMRTENGYKQSFVAKCIGISQAAYSMIESGKRRPSVKTAKKLAELFKV